MTPGILQATAITFKYDSADHEALKEISFDIYPGSVTAILGPNGAGKTTLLHLLLGLNRPASGTILLYDKPVNQYSRHEPVSRSVWCRKLNMFLSLTTCWNL